LRCGCSRGCFWRETYLTAILALQKLQIASTFKDRLEETFKKLGKGFCERQQLQILESIAVVVVGGKV
jgi:hypothetical protein